MPTEYATQALSNLRDGSLFNWTVIPLFVLVLYVYSVEIERRNWNVLFGGLAFWGMDWFNEIWNSLVFHFSGYAPMWCAPADTAFLILIGLNIEICFMFAVLGIVATKTLPADRNMKVAGLPNRWFAAIAGSILAVIVEIALNAVNALTWEWSWWSMTSPWPIFLVGYIPFLLTAFWVHDMPSVRRKATTVGCILGFDALCLVVFGPILGWI